MSYAFTPDWSEVDRALAGATYPVGGTPERGKVVTPGAVLLVGQRGKSIYHRAFGARSVVPAVTPINAEMVFDVASLTKALVTTTLTMQAVDSGQLTLERRLSHIIQSFSTHGKERISIRHLLTHTSGFAGTFPFYKTVARADIAERSGMMTSRGAADFVYNELARSKLEYRTGEKTVYSDLGFILLGHALEVVAGGKRLDKLAEHQIFQKLGLRSMGFIDLSRIRRRGLAPVQEQIVPTAECPWRKKILCGEVHDDNAYVMGGIAGHAGIFSTATDLHRLAFELIECWHGRSNLVRQETIQRFWTRDGIDPGSTWALGWDTPSAEGSSAGSYFGPHTVGHLGFTGCSIWIDPEKELDVILLTNRVHPSVDNYLIKEFRPAIHNLVMGALGYADSPQ